jgi:hypothetical protein
MIPPTTPRCNSILTEALSYAARGWPVLPLTGKKPAIKKGVYGAECGESFVKRRFATGKNIGIQTGKVSGIVVIDVDPRNGGDATLSDLIAKHGALPETLESATGGGGFHIFFNHPGIKLRGKLGTGIDVKSDGGYVVAPPSVHPDTKQRYSWRNDYGLADMPQWMLETLTQARTKREVLSETIPEGKRNSTLFEIGAALKKKGASSSKIETHLLEENRIRCAPPLPDEEVHTIASNAASQENRRSFKTQWQEAVMNDTSLSMYQRGILIGLSLYMDVDGKSCYPAMETIAIRFNVGRKSLGKALEAGEERGWIERYKRPKQQHDPGKQKWSYGYIAKMKPL